MPQALDKPASPSRPDPEARTKYQHALFLNPYLEKNATNAMMLFPPTGLEYVATSAKGFVKKITLLDLRFEKELSTPEKVLEFINNEIDIVCVAIGWDRQLEEICRLLDRIPKNIPVVVGGYTATEKVEELFALCPRIDIVIRGEGERTIQEILSDKNLRGILGISFKDDRRIIHNANRPFDDVNAIAPPDRALRRNDYALSINGIRIPHIKFDTVLSARGCPFKCKFCTFSLNPLGQKRNFETRSAESVVDEIQALSAGIILFSDDNLFANPKRAEKICDLIIERKIKKRFVAQTRLDIASNPRLLQKIVKAGFKVLLIGIESPHDWILKQLDKGFDQATVRKAFAVLTKYPIFYNAYFIYGNIGETEEEMLYIAEFAKEIGVDSLAGNKLRIEKFSPLKDLALNTPGYHITERGELYSDTYSHAALKKIGKRIKHSFYTPARYLRIFFKIFFIEQFFTFKEILQLFLYSPVIIASLLHKEYKRGRLKASLLRPFLRNA